MLYHKWIKEITCKLHEGLRRNQIQNSALNIFLKLNFSISKITKLYMWLFSRVILNTSSPRSIYHNKRLKHVHIDQEYAFAMAYLGPCLKTAMEVCCKNSKRLRAVNYFRNRAPSYIFARVLNTSLFRLVFWLPSCKYFFPTIF